jgi:hypothetical protein
VGGKILACFNIKQQMESAMAKCSAAILRRKVSSEEDWLLLFKPFNRQRTVWHTM